MGSESARPTAAKRSRSESLEMVAGAVIAPHSVTPCASTQVHFAAGRGAPRRAEPGLRDTAPMPDHIVSLDAILAAREVVAGHVHRTPMLSSGDRCRLPRTTPAART